MEKDIHQGGISDCGLMSGLAGFAKLDPNWIQPTIVPLGDGTYAVRFFKTAKNPVYYQIDGKLPVVGRAYYEGADPGAADGTRAALLQNAFALYRLDQGTYNSVHA